MTQSSSGWQRSDMLCTAGLWMTLYLMLLKSRSYVCGDVTLGKPRDTQCSDVLATMTIDYVAATAAAQYGDVGDVWTNAVGASSFRAP